MMAIGRRLRTVLVSAVVVPILAGMTPAAAVNVAHSVIVNANPVDWTPHVASGQVNAIVQIGNRVIVGGAFTQVQQTANGALITRNNIFAFNATTGAIDTGFVPNLNGSVLALAPAPDGNVFVGGNFTTVNGVSSNKLAKLDVTTGQRIASFTGTTDGRVRELVVRGNTLYVAGSFTRLSGAARGNLGAVNATTGAVDPNLNLPMTDPHAEGTTPFVYTIDVSPDGKKLVAIGNFTKIGGIERWQAGMIDLSTTPATVANWETDRFRSVCSSSFFTYMRDVDFSPDGSYFAIVTTGAFFGGASSGTLCDTASRWESAATGENLNPTWTDYSGGDTLSSVAVTGTAVYVGGHQRWLNNPFAGDAPGPGAVSRQGIAALDPVNGVPFSWNPGRVRGVGVFAMYSTPAGLWVGSDTDVLGGETHRKLGMFPTAGGTTVPPNQRYGLPADLFNAPLTTCAQTDPNVFHRVNAGGPAVAAVDCGRGWSADASDTDPGAQLRTPGSNAAPWSTVPTRLPSVPSTAPNDLFLSERWDPAALPEMEWAFPVAIGTNVQVRLYFANQCSCTNDPGERVFDVSIDGSLVLDNFDVVAAARAESAAADGHQDALMRSFSRTSDGVVNISFGHVTQNPFINAIEIVRSGWTPVFSGGAQTLGRRSFNGTTVGPHGTLSTPGFDWSTTRGAAVINGFLYHGTSDGRLVVHSFNGSSLGPGQDVNLNGLTNFPLANLTGMFFDTATERLYYTVSGDANLYWRWFTPESRIVGAERFAAGGSVNWSLARGVTMADGKIYFAQTDGNLYAVNFVNGAPSGSASVVSPASAGYHWASRSLFVFGSPTTADTTAPTRPGKPSGQSTSPGTIDLTWAGSTDNVSITLTYHVFRGTTEVGTVSTSQSTVTFRDTGLAGGSTHTYSVVAEDAAGNDSPASPTSDPITVQSAGDTTAPTRPGKPSGQSNAPGTIDLTWAGSTDNVSTTLTYHVLRGTTEVGTVSSSQSTVTFRDTGLAGGSTHTYSVVAEDAAGNDSPASPTSDPITVQSGTAAIFSDNFSSGNFSAWTAVNGLTIDTATGDPSPPSARGQVSGQRANASKTLGATYNDICMSTRVNPSNLDGNSVDLLRLRTAANGPIVRVYASSSGVLWIRSDFSGEQRSSGVSMTLGAWNRIELCGTVSPGTWSLYRNGTRIVNGWTANTGTTPIGIVQIGEAQAKTWTMNFDDVVVDQSVG